VLLLEDPLLLPHTQLLWTYQPVIPAVRQTRIRELLGGCRTRV